MSFQTVTSNTGSQLFVNTDTSKIFIGENYTRQEVFINNTNYNPDNLAAGTVMGRVTATGAVVPFDATASDGSQYVVGILGNDLSILPGAIVTASIVVKGEVSQSQVILYVPGQTLSTVVNGRQIRDRITGDTAGIILVPSTDLTGFDNS